MASALRAERNLIWVCDVPKCTACFNLLNQINRDFMQNKLEIPELNPDTKENENPLFSKGHLGNPYKFPHGRCKGCKRYLAEFLLAKLDYGLHQHQNNRQYRRHRHPSQKIQTQYCGSFDCYKCNLDCHTEDDKVNYVAPHEKRGNIIRKDTSNPHKGPKNFRERMDNNHDGAILDLDTLRCEGCQAIAARITIIRLEYMSHLASHWEVLVY